MAYTTSVKWQLGAFVFITAVIVVELYIILGGVR